ncbi:MAG: hypothetical protein ACFBSF_10020 [Leptolyngbyaceae cyanobacterium]
MNQSLIFTKDSASSGNAWCELSVRDFFGKIAWSGVVDAPSPPAEEISSGTLDMLMSVHAFFDCFPWEGPLDVAAPLAPLTLQPDSPTLIDDLTLDSFAELF